MRRFVALLALIVMVTLPTVLHAADTGFYLGVGGSYAFENFDVDVDLDGVRYDFDFDDAWGVNGRLGYHISDLLALAFDFDYLSRFDADDRVVVFGIPVDTEAEVDVFTFMLAAKVSPNLGLERLRPYAIGGAGLMYGEVDAEATALGVTVSDSDSETDACAKLGLGLDFYITQEKNISLGLEGNYVWGFGDLDEIRYFNVTLGIAYHFLGP